MTLSFSDGTNVDWQMEKSVLPHELRIEKKRTEWVRLSRLIKSEDPSPFPALSQIEVYGTETFTTTGMQKEENYEPERADAERSAI